MTPGPRRPARTCVAVCVLLAAWLAARAVPSAAAGQSAGREVRALWVLRTSLTSPERIAALVQAARAHRFNTLLVQVRGRGDAYYDGGLEPRAADLGAGADGFDPLRTVLTDAHAAGLEVHAWINLNLVSSAVTLPRDRGHVLNRHPEWLMVPRALAPQLARVSPSSAGYVDRIARWTRMHADQVEGLYVSPILPGAVDHANAVVRDIVRRYDLDGVHFDYARYPGPDFDYSAAALDAFRAAVRPTLDERQRRTLDTRSRSAVTAYADALPGEWTRFRTARMTAMMRRLRATVTAERPTALVSVAVKPDAAEAARDRFQDWSGWLEHGVIDVACPMAYTPDARLFAAQIGAAQASARGRAIWAGIGAYRLPAAGTVANIETARRLGTAGVILFSYDSLTDPETAAAGYLTAVEREAFGPGAPEGDR
jgi:uncharacterized lipoprotein YddW (UPF0748 family)